MNKLQIQEKTKKLLEKAAAPEEFTKDLQALLHALVDREKMKNYQRIIPDTGKFYRVPKPSLWIIASEIGKFIKREPEKASGDFYYRYLIPTSCRVSSSLASVSSIVPLII